MEKSTADMWELTSAVYLHGANVDTLQTVLPNWTRTEILQVLQKYKNKAARERANIEEGKYSAALQTTKIKTEPNDKDYKFCCNASLGVNMKGKDSQAALSNWIKVLQQVHSLEGSTDKGVFGVKPPKNAPIKDHSQLLSKVMLHTACFEDHYHGGHPEDTCYSEIYRYLSQLLAGEEPTQLRPKSAAKVLEMVDRLTEMLNTNSFDGMQAFLRGVSLSNINNIDDANVTAGSSSNKSFSAAATAGPGCSSGSSPIKENHSIALFEETLDSLNPDNSGLQSIGEACQQLDPLHPYFEEKRRAVNNKLVEMQKASAATLQDVRGLNPLRLPTEALTKPIDAFPPTYPAPPNRLSTKNTHSKIVLR